MYEYTCECGDVFNEKNDYTKHIEQECPLFCEDAHKKKPRCKYCKKELSRRDALKRHIVLKQCKKMPISKKNNNDINTKVNGDSAFSANTSLHGDRNNINNTITNGNITINLVIFGQDGIKDLDKNDCIKLFTCPSPEKNFLEELIKIINLNPKKPEHHNVLYTNLNSSYGKTYQEDGWKLQKIEEICENVVYSKFKDLDTFTDEYPDLDDTWKQVFEGIKKRYDPENKTTGKNFTNYVKMLFFFCRDMVIETMKKSGTYNNDDLDLNSDSDISDSFPKNTKNLKHPKSNKLCNRTTSFDSDELIFVDSDDTVDSNIDSINKSDLSDNDSISEKHCTAKKSAKNIKQSYRKFSSSESDIETKNKCKDYPNHAIELDRKKSNKSTADSNKNISKKPLTTSKKSESKKQSIKSRNVSDSSPERLLDSNDLKKFSSKDYNLKKKDYTDIFEPKNLGQKAPDDPFAIHREIIIANQGFLDSNSDNDSDNDSSNDSGNNSSDDSENNYPKSKSQIKKKTPPKFKSQVKKKTTTKSKTSNKY